MPNLRDKLLLYSAQKAVHFDVTTRAEVSAEISATAKKPQTRYAERDGTPSTFFT
jgi:hypothetical protein